MAVEWVCSKKPGTRPGVIHCNGSIMPKHLPAPHVLNQKFARWNKVSCLITRPCMSCHQKFFPFIFFRSLTIARNKAAQRMKQADKTSIQRIPGGGGEPLRRLLGRVKQQFWS